MQSTEFNCVQRLNDVDFERFQILGDPLVAAGLFKLLVLTTCCYRSVTWATALTEAASRI